MNRTSDVIIVGAGASGLMTGIIAARKGLSVTIFEKENVSGKKLLATGNGRCNLSNKQVTPSDYYGNSQFVKDIVNRFGPDDTIKFFKKIGLLTTCENDYIYPASLQAETVRNALRDYCINLGVKIKNNNEVTQIEKIDDEFIVTAGIEFKSKKLILSTGGRAGLKNDNVNIYYLPSMLGHTIIKPKPALCALLTEKSPLSLASGVRVNGTIHINDISEYGQIQITDYGISGIAVFNVSHIINKNDIVYLDFERDFSINEIKNKIISLQKAVGFMSVVSGLNGMINDKLAVAILNKCSISDKIKMNQLTEEMIEKISNTIKSFPLKIIKKRDFQFAQVTSGGVDTKEVNSNTMESKIVNGLYFTGEILDVDGKCGGYNLQFAWSTSFIAGENLKK